MSKSPLARAAVIAGCLLVIAGVMLILQRQTAQLVADYATHPQPRDDKDRSMERQRMVDTQIRARGVTNLRVLDAMRRVARHQFVPAAYQSEAYADHPLPIGEGQTISQPYIVGLMTQLLDPGPQDKVLEIGTGSGYQAAILGRLAREVYTIEIVDTLAASAARRLDELNCHNVHLLSGDGYKGWPEHAPFDAIMVTAAPEQIPQPLIDQLKLGGRMVLPVGPPGNQQLKLLVKKESGIETHDQIPVRFVPMTGEVMRRNP